MKIKAVLAIVIALSGMLIPARAEDDTSDSPREIWLNLKGLYAYFMGSQISGVPISYAKNSTQGEIVKSSSPAPVVGIGYSFAGIWEKTLLDIEIEYSSGRFSDWRVDGRRLTFLNAKFNFGFLPAREAACGIYALVIGGFIFQSDYKERGSWEGLDEHLGKTVNTVAIGLALKYSPFRHFVLRGEAYTMWQSGGGEWRTADYSEHGTFYTPGLGTRIAGGIELHW